MITVRSEEHRGRANLGWLDSRHSFSFGNYYDPEQMGYRVLRVINEDRVEPGRGFGMHPHQDMEILSYVLAGSLEHRDSLGNGSLVRAGELQRMTAGTGIRHSEYNPSEEQELHLLQIWILPIRPGLPPSYGQRAFDLAAQPGQLQLMASPDGRDRSLRIHQQAAVLGAVLAPGQLVSYQLEPQRYAWLQVVRGQVVMQGQQLSAGAGAAVADERRVTIGAESEAEVLLFDLP